jgi:hypothetical protein
MTVATPEWDKALYAEQRLEVQGDQGRGGKAGGELGGNLQVTTARRQDGPPSSGGRLCAGSKASKGGIP